MPAAVYTFRPLNLCIIDAQSFCVTILVFIVFFQKMLLVVQMALQVYHVSLWRLEWPIRGGDL